MTFDRDCATGSVRAPAIPDVGLLIKVAGMGKWMHEQKFEG